MVEPRGVEKAMRKDRGREVRPRGGDGKRTHISTGAVLWAPVSWAPALHLGVGLFPGRLTPRFPKQGFMRLSYL